MKSNETSVEALKNKTEAAGNALLAILWTMASLFAILGAVASKL